MKNGIPYRKKAEEVWSIGGSFGSLRGDAAVTENGCNYGGDGFEIREDTRADDSGVLERRGTFRNTAAAPVVLTRFGVVFALDNGDYEVYTQYNGWQNESRGGWQPLVTGVTSSVESVRTSAGAAPVLALWNRQTGRGWVFHLLPRFAWEMRVQRRWSEGETAAVTVEIGMNSRNLVLEVAPGETLALPEVLYYEFENRTDLDCARLHRFCAARFPRREMPVMYNTWLHCFDRLSFEAVQSQIEPAARLGCEYFVIDAGWFGNGADWGSARGDWQENQTGALRGRMAEIAAQVRENGMKFGFWLELESASPQSDIIRRHPDYYRTEGDCRFFDFENEEACAALFQTVKALIDRYQARFLKLDFNQDMREDRDHAAFLRYLDSYRAFLRRLKQRYPDLYLEGCASGGMRTNLSLCDTFDSVWFSDNQSVQDGIRIYKDTLLRMPPQMIDKWAVIRSLPGIPDYDNLSPERLISTRDATWGAVESVDPTALQAFLLGGPFGFSCDLTQLSSSAAAALAAFIRTFKQERGFWQNAACSILAETESVLVLQYEDARREQIVLTAFFGSGQQKTLRLFPRVRADGTYRIGDTLRSGADLLERGMTVPVPGNHRAAVLTLLDTSL